MRWFDYMITRRLFVAGLVVALLCVTWMSRITAAEPDYISASGLVRFDGDIDAPDFTLVAPDGTKISLSDFRGKVVLLNFWATW
jgi:cytochrome oxidase Cu insertion factor (SCO1/SenC/PrrC family)